jgi:hypothetical protein
MIQQFWLGKNTPGICHLAWEALNMAQIDALDKLQNIFGTQVEIEKQLETKYMNKYIKYV